jgi:alkaline phosphatase D
MLWLGDNVYYREMDWLTEAAMRYRWRKDRQLPDLQPLLASTHHYAIWDDHDFGPNNSDRSFRLKGEALDVFSDYFPSLQRGTPETRGCFFRFEWGDVEFFMLDNRYWRAPNDLPDGPSKTMFGQEQLQWLKDSLVSSIATFKVIAVGGQMVQPMVFFEAFGLFPTEQKDLFDFIAQTKVPGVVFLSGDRHAGELLEVQWPGAPYPWYEMTSSPLTAGSGRIEREAENPARVPGTWVTRTRHYGIVQVSGPRGGRKLTLSQHDKSGKQLWRHVIDQAELREPPAQ